MKHSLYFLVCALLAACSKGAGPEPKNADMEPKPVPDISPIAAPAPPSTAEGGNGLVYEFFFGDAKAVVSICVDGPFARVDETWESFGGAPGRRWGADKSRLIFDSANRLLTVVNHSKNTFVKVDETRMAKAQDDLEKGTPMALGNLGAKRGAGAALEPAALPMLAVPVPSKSPKKTHPPNCTVFERDLPQGLREETCFSGFDEDPPVSEVFSPLVSFANFFQGLDVRVRELETVAAVANAIEWDTGLPSAQFKFGDSPFEEDSTGLESWDRTFVLKERTPCAVLPADLDPPKGAEEEFGLLPWNTPFIVTALPK